MQLNSILGNDDNSGSARKAIVVDSISEIDNKRIYCLHVCDDSP